ncbi:hypothetical protein [Methanogenium cariaci]|uniref:hypothetical protein n=1 Tax=Methanogenium cariaci TaxID=2197 RepID=UPI001FDED508|nr:hypothetical protein [Methanogenium cariaci]
MTDDLKQKVQTKCREMEVPLFGIADVCRWEDSLLNPDMPEAFYPRSIWPEAQSVLVIGSPPCTSLFSKLRLPSGTVRSTGRSTVSLTSIPTGWQSSSTGRVTRPSRCPPATAMDM